MAAVAAAASSKQKADALKSRNVELNFEVARLLSEVDAVKKPRAVLIRLGCNVEKITASLIDTANMRDEAVKRP